MSLARGRNVIFKSLWILPTISFHIEYTGTRPCQGTDLIYKNI